MCASGADEDRGTVGVAVHYSDSGQAAKAFKHLGPDDHVAAEREFLAERTRGGLGLTRQQRSQTKLPLLIICSN